MSTPSPVEIAEPDVDEIVELEDPWVTIVWNDPVNLMSYVAYVFRNYFGYTEEKAHELMPPRRTPTSSLRTSPRS